MKIAYLLIIHKNPIHVNKLIKALHTENADFFIHIDKKSKVKFDLPKFANIKILNNPINVYWGGFSQVQAIISLLKESSKSPSYDYYILLSDSDYPLRSNTHIMNYLLKNKNKEFINVVEMPGRDKTFDRVECVYFEGSTNNITAALLLRVNKFLRKNIIKRKLPKQYANLVLYGGCQWWGLSRSCISYILQFIDSNPEFVHFYKNTYIPDEMFFHTIIGNSIYKQNIVNSFTYTDWYAKHVTLPAQIRMSHMEILSKSILPSDYGIGKMHALFARKFADESSEVVQYIDETLRV